MTLHDPKVEPRSLWCVEDLRHQRWSFTTRAHNASDALRLARECGFEEPATVRQVVRTKAEGRTP